MSSIGPFVGGLPCENNFYSLKRVQKMPFSSLDLLQGGIECTICVKYSTTQRVAILG